MSDFEQFHVNNFDQFCKTLLKNEAKNAWRAINKQRDREITAGTAEDMAWLLPSEDDTYSTYHKVFYVKDIEITVTKEFVGEALQYILPSLRNVLLLSFFGGYNDTQIAKILKISNPTVAYRGRKAMERLKEEMEARLNAEEY